MTVEEDDFFDDEDLTALAEAVREAGRNTTGLQVTATAEPADTPGKHRRDEHPALRKRTTAENTTGRRGHLHVVRDAD